MKRLLIGLSLVLLGASILWAGGGALDDYTVHNSSDDARVYLVVTGDDGIISMYDTSDTENVRIHTDGDSWFNGGYFGIGTAAPASPLHVAGDIRIDDGSTQRTMGFYRSGVLAGYLTANGSGLNMRAQNGQYLLLSDDAGLGISIIDGGNVGIGIAAPLVPLHAYKTSGPQIHADSGNAANVAEILISGSNVSRFLRLRHPPTDLMEMGWDNGDGMIFGEYDDPSDTTIDGKVWIHSSGNVGIGTATPLVPLEVNSGSNAYDDGLRVTRAGVATQYVGLGTYASGLIEHVAVDKDFIIQNNGGTGDMGFNTNGTNRRMTIADTGEVTIAGDLLVDGTNIGITADPDLIAMASAALTIDGTVQTGDLTITDASPYLYLVDSDGGGSSFSQSGASFYIGGHNTGSTMVFRNRNSYAESARFDTSGNLLLSGNLGIIGDTDLITMADSALTVNGSVGIDGATDTELFMTTGSESARDVASNWIEKGYVFVDNGDPAQVLWTSPTVGTDEVWFVEAIIMARNIGNTSESTWKIFATIEEDTGVAVKNEVVLYDYDNITLTDPDFDIAGATVIINVVSDAGNDLKYDAHITITKQEAF